MSQRARRGLASWMTGSTTPFFVLDHRRVILVFNRGCEDLTGWTAGDVIGKTCDFVPSPIPDQVECVTSALCPPQAAFAQDGVSQHVVIQSKSGTVSHRTIHFHLLTGEDSDDGKLRVLGVIAPHASTEEVRAPNAIHFALANLLSDLHTRYSVDNIVAGTSHTQQLLAQVAIARENRYPVHFIGANGVGKEHLARAIHYGSSMKLARFVPLRCRDSSHFEIQRGLRQMIEEKQREAQVYLDHVDHMPRDLQEVVLSAAREQPQLRWMSSSKDDLPDSDSLFSQELRHYLETQTLRVPPLVERSAEVLLLAQHLLEACNRDQEKQIEGFASEVSRRFLLYNWPGNIDELGRNIQTAWTNSQGPLIEMADLPIDFQIGFDAQQLGPSKQPGTLDERVKQFEWDEISKALKEANGNKTTAAKSLGIPRAKLYRRMETLGIETDD